MPKHQVSQAVQFTARVHTLQEYQSTAALLPETILPKTPVLCGVAELPAYITLITVHSTAITALMAG